MFGSIVVDRALQHCELLHSVCDLKAVKISDQYWELILNRFESVLLGLVGFYGIPAVVGYLMLNLVDIYIYIYIYI